MIMCQSGHTALLSLRKRFPWVFGDFEKLSFWKFLLHFIHYWLLACQANATHRQGSLSLSFPPRHCMSYLQYLTHMDTDCVCTTRVRQNQTWLEPKASKKGNNMVVWLLTSLGLGFRIATLARFQCKAPIDIQVCRVLVILIFVITLLLFL